MKITHGSKISVIYSGTDLYFLDTFVDTFRGSSYMRIQFLPDGNLFVLIITNKVVINK